MVRIVVQILIRVCILSIHFDVNAAVLLSCQECVKEGEASILLELHGELNCNCHTQGSLYKGNDLPGSANSEEGCSTVTETSVCFSFILESWIKDNIMDNDMDQLRISLGQYIVEIYLRFFKISAHSPLPISMYIL